jgi:hypothetical protein
MVRYQYGQWFEIEAGGKYRIRGKPRKPFTVAQAAAALDVTPSYLYKFIGKAQAGTAMLIAPSDVARLGALIDAKQAVRQSSKWHGGQGDQWIRPMFQGWLLAEKTPCIECGTLITIGSTRCIPCKGRLSGWSKEQVHKAGCQQAARWYPLQPCEVCGTTKDVERHHRDRNPTNNAPDNIGFLCGEHHAAHHLRERADRRARQKVETK